MAKTKKIVAICSPYQGQMVAITDKGEIIVARDAVDLKKQVNQK